jgi:hypothetical protein
LATLTIVAAWIDDRDIPERSDAGIAFGIFRSPTVDASRFSPSLPLRLAPAAKRSTPLFFCELEELFLPLAKPLANAKGLVDRPESARAALEHVLMLLGRKRNDVRIFDEDGQRRSPADLCRLAADEVAMLPDESGLSF